jgi:serine/threonine-protein kinase RsbW/stage II sporulation protein AB (anti-sigma F factor)
VIAPATDTLTRSYPAVPESVPAVRRDVCNLAEGAGARDETIEAIRLAASEAVTNAVLHAYRDGQGAVEVTAAVVSGEMWLFISDQGRGLKVRSDRPGLGLGLALIANVCDEFTVGAPTSGGVELRMRFSLGSARGGGTTQSRGFVSSATRPASARFSTTL